MSLEHWTTVLWFAYGAVGIAAYLVGIACGREAERDKQAERKP